jgi:hypothetical protein
MQSYLAKVKRNWKISFQVFSTFIAGAFMQGCGDGPQPVFDSLNRTIASKEVQGLHVILSVPGGTYFCILEPYASRVSSMSAIERDVNKYLESINYQGDETHWTIVYGNTLHWEIEKPRRKKAELIQKRNSMGQIIDSVCGQVTELQFVKPKDGLMGFSLKKSE